MAVQAEIKPHHVNQILTLISNDFYYMYSVCNIPDQSSTIVKYIDSKDVGKWITVIKRDRGFPMVTLSRRGNAYGC